jgi:hypothetical protein
VAIPGSRPRPIPFISLQFIFHSYLQFRYHKIRVGVCAVVYTINKYINDVLKAYIDREVIIYAFVVSLRDACEWSLSRSGRVA